MQVQRIGYRVRGLYRVAGLGMKWGMIAPDTEKRLKILRFWEEHGLKTTDTGTAMKLLEVLEVLNSSEKLRAWYRDMIHKLKLFSD